ncbi:Uncharacterised protein [Mycobacterium tuberculosis]|uniref:Uncharacterized protein n=1 Tax=Mycobacterium tuberculosis TaxID=1773 RepID=A0A654U754_MYCTX|nr:Uncharacterised protein [Mycobacterium tuberculosis]
MPRSRFTQGATVFTPKNPVTFSGWRNIMMNATGPPQSWATSLTLATPRPSKTAARSSAISVLVYRERGAELQPAPRRSGHSTRLPSAASGPMRSRHSHQFCGKPCTSITAGPSAGPASATWILTPSATSTCRCSTPSKAGRAIIA